MRRSAALAPLSRDHHDALVIAMALTRATEATVGSASMLFADFILEHEARHFALEESLLLPVLGEEASARELAEQVLADHRHLRDAARELRLRRMQPSVEGARAIGARFRAHVQLEERRLFPYVEESLDPRDLEQLGARLEAAHRRGPVTRRR